MCRRLRRNHDGSRNRRTFAPAFRAAADAIGAAAASMALPALDLAEGSLEQVCAPPTPAVAYRVAKVHDERVEVIGQALGGGGVADLVELPDQN